MAEGGRTVPIISLAVFDVIAPLLQRDYFVSLQMVSRAILDSGWAEDRATVGTDPSADPVAETGDGATRFAPLPFMPPGLASMR